MEGVITVGDIIDKALTGMFGNFIVAAVILPAAIIFGCRQDLCAKLFAGSG